MVLGEELPEPPGVSASDLLIYDLARTGDRPEHFRDLLRERAPEERTHLLDTSHTDAKGQTCPALVIAALNGNYSIVRLLLDEFWYNIDLETTGKVYLGGYFVKGATALWCAAGSGHFDIVRALVEAGANVNSNTTTKSTPLRAACFEGRLDIVKYLVSKNADIHIANKFNNTCLMVAADKGHTQVVRFLLDHKADPDTLACCGASALHYSAESGNLPIVKELVEYGGANIGIVNKHRMTPIMSSAERCQEDVFMYLLSKTTDRRERIIALELIGASFANDKDKYDITKAYFYLKKGMETRWEDSDDIVTKDVAPPIEAYDNHAECRTLEDLEAIRDVPDELHMEGLVIRERILGQDNPELTYPIFYAGAVFADQANFPRCIQLWLHALRIKRTAKTSVVEDLLRFSQIFSQMLEVGVSVPFEELHEVLLSASKEIELCQGRISHQPAEDDSECHLEDLENNMTIFLYLTVILSKIIKQLPEENVVDSMRCLHQVSTVLKPTTRKGQTLLHLAVDSETIVDDFHTNSIVRFPCSATTKLLIDAGADVGAMNAARNTPLHVIVGYRDSVADFLTLHSIIGDLLKAGAHVDAVNGLGQTPMQIASSTVAGAILRAQQSISLKCLSAQAVKRYNLSYVGQVPEALVTFVELHGP